MSLNMCKTNVQICLHVTYVILICPFSSVFPNAILFSTAVCIYLYPCAYILVLADAKMNMEHGITVSLTGYF